MIVTKLEIPDVLLIEPKVHGDPRGFFMETWQSKRYAEHGVTEQFLQDNVSFSAKGVLRGVHLQNPNAQGKLVQVLHGEVFDVAVDLRRSSKHFGRWVGARLSAENKRQLWVPPGFGHGFLVTSENALFCYKCTQFYAPSTEITVRWDDPDVGIQWPLDGATPSLSARDGAAPHLRDIPKDRFYP